MADRRPARVAALRESLTAAHIDALVLTSLPNIRYLTEKGHKIYSEDLLTASTDPALLSKDEQGNVVLDGKRFLEENLVYPAAQFDVVLCWNLADYLDESLVKPVMGRLWSVLKPGGMLLAFFHTKEAGPDAPCYRFHITGNDTLEMQPIESRREVRRGQNALAGLRGRGSWQSPQHRAFLSSQHRRRTSWRGRP